MGTSLDLPARLCYGHDMTSNEAGRPRTIDAKGNIVPKPYGKGRWHSPRVFKCHHDNCETPAAILSGAGKAHNCCGTHDHEETFYE